MSSAPIFLVAGPSGSGKTFWIHEQLSKEKSAVYLTLDSDASIDASYLSVEFPTVLVLRESLKHSVARQVLEQVSAGLKVYIEIAFSVDLSLLHLPFEPRLCQRVAVVPPVFRSQI